VTKRFVAFHLAGHRDSLPSEDVPVRPATATPSRGPRCQRGRSASWMRALCRRRIGTWLLCCGPDW